MTQAIINEVMNERGITTEKHRITIVDCEVIGKSDQMKVSINITPPRKRKATLNWTLVINFVRGIIDWEKSTFTWL